MTAWIHMIPDEDADEALTEVLALARTPHGTVDNVMEQYKRENRAAMARQAERRAARQAFWRRVKAWFAGLVSGGRQAPLRRPTLQGGF